MANKTDNLAAKVRAHERERGQGQREVEGGRYTQAGKPSDRYTHKKGYIDNTYLPIMEPTMRGNIPRLRLIWRAAWSDGVMQIVGMCGLYLAVRGLGLAVR